MSHRGDGIATSTLRRWVAHLLLLAVVARALIPAGYMPDFSAAAHGAFKVVICSAMGVKTVDLNADGKPLPEKQGSHHDQPCAFAGLAILALPTLDAVQFSAPEFQTSALLPNFAVQLPPSRAGPPLGSRGPPDAS